MSTSVSPHPSPAEGHAPPAGDDTILEVQFDDLVQQHETSMLGMWLFLATEVMFFGGLIAAYVVYRATSPHEFALASQHLKLWLGCVNTVVLLGSSLAMSLALLAASAVAPPPRPAPQAAQCSRTGL